MTMQQESFTFLIKSRFGKLLQFLSSQGLTLMGNVLYGILCVRLLPSSEYAKFVVLFGTIGTLVTLMDINFSGSLIPLIGERVDDRQLIADYVASLRRLSYVLFGVLGTAVIFLYPLFVKHRGWSGWTVGEMIVLLLISCWFLRVSATYGTVMLVLRDRTLWYRGQMISSFGTLALLLVLWLGGWLNGLAAILLNVTGIVFVGVFYHRRAVRLLEVRGVASLERQRDIIRLAAPNVPQAIFFALQGQIALFLIAYFGRTAAVASVGGLSRLSQLFMLFMQMNPVLVEPYFAKLPRARLVKSYLAALLVAGAVCVTVIVLAAQVPWLFLWVLGPQYQGLTKEVLLVIAASGVGCFSGVLWAIHSARRFVYWGSNAANILLILVVQIVFIYRSDLGTVRSVLWITLATSLATLLVNILTGVYGFLRGPRPMLNETPVVEGTIAAAAVLDEVSLTASGLAESLGSPLPPNNRPNGLPASELK